MAAVVMLVMAIRLVPNEPSYQGKPLNAWIAYMRSESLQRTAFEAMGPRCIPFIVAKIGHKEPLVYRTYYRGVFLKLPPVVRKYVPRPRFPAFLEPGQAGRLLGCIGPAAAPDLLKLADHSNPDVRQAAITALGKIGAEGPEVLPTLARALRSDPDDHVKLAAILAVWEYDPERIAAVGG
ncbi:MAG: HEAT repeat domain-containing protein, partial [Limisphaerales bacterium]